MKTSLLILVISVFCTGNVFTQAQIDSTNIVREILQQQILMAKEKQKSSQLESRNVIIPVTAVPKTKIEQEEDKSFEFSPLGIKMLILGFASVVVFSFVFIGRKKNAKIEKNKVLKANIKKIRNEQLVVSIDPRLKAIRKKLVLNASYLNTKDTARFVKENKLGLSELSLATKLHEYETAVTERYL